MTNKFDLKAFLDKHVSVVIIALTILLYIVTGLREGVFFWGGVAALISFGRKNSLLNRHPLINDRFSLTVVAVACITAVAITTLPMSLSPEYNGEIPGRDEYELLADSIIHGKVYIDYDYVDPLLLEMENPYDPAARDEIGVSYHWDHAFYNGKYYMYFGVVPVFLLYIPYELITGSLLLSYHATQIFTGLFIIGLFMLLYEIAARFFPDIKLGQYIFPATALSVICVFDCVQMPAMYCTAISSGICMMVWSVFFYFRAVLVESNVKKQIIYAVLGAVPGALAFGCRPTCALGNLVFIPLALIFIRQHKDEKKIRIFRSFLIIAIPYMVVAIGLMYYNYIRFDNPFEFGQSYQLTIADQSQYGNVLSTFSPVSIVNAILWNFIRYTPLEAEFPYFDQGGFLVGYPLFWVITVTYIVVMATGRIKNEMYKKTVVWTVLVSVIITVAVCLWTPYMSKRYRLDIYYLLAVIGFIMLLLYESGICDESKRKRYYTIVSTASVFSVVLAMFMFLYTFDGDFAQYYPSVVEKIGSILMFK